MSAVRLRKDLPSQPPVCVCVLGRGVRTRAGKERD